MQDKEENLKVAFTQVTPTTTLVIETDTKTVVKLEEVVGKQKKVAEFILRLFYYPIYLICGLSQSPLVNLFLFLLWLSLFYLLALDPPCLANP